MTEFEFFTNREERWGVSMRALWGNLSICPILDHMDLPYHTVGELLSISCLKVWGTPKSPRMVWLNLLVKVEDASEIEGYGMALVWISPHQALGIYDGRGIRNSIHLHLQWAQLAICPNPVI